MRSHGNHYATTQVRLSVHGGSSVWCRRSSVCLPWRAADGDSDAFNQIFYSQSTDGQNWSEPTTVLSTDYTFADSVAQDSALSHGTDAPLGVGAYYSGRAYGPSVVQNLDSQGNPDGTLTMVFAGYRLPKPIEPAGTVMGTNTSAQYTVGATDPALYRNILTVELDPSTGPPAGTPEAPNVLMLGAAGIVVLGSATAYTRRRRRTAAQEV
jgi:hypothetical protein